MVLFYMYHPLESLPLVPFGFYDWLFKLFVFSHLDVGFITSCMFFNCKCRGYYTLRVLYTQGISHSRYFTVKSDCSYIGSCAALRLRVMAEMTRIFIQDFIFTMFLVSL